MVNPLGVLTSLKKNQLVKKGFACGKTRRRPVDSQLLRSLESSGQVKTLIFLSFLIGLAALIFYGSGQQQDDTGSAQAKQFLFALLVFFTALAQLWINHPQTFERNSRVVLMFGTILFHLLVVKVLLVLIHNGSIRHEIGALIFPYALAPLVISALLGKNQGIYVAIFVSLWGSILWMLVDAIPLAMSLISGFVAVFVTLHVRRRSQFIRAGVYVGVAIWLLALSFGLIEVNWMSPSRDELAHGGLSESGRRRQRGDRCDAGEWRSAGLGADVPHHHRDFVAGADRPESPVADAPFAGSAGNL